jgi:protein-S-isoprenylcysteine O-methyltransferase Ste14
VGCFLLVLATILFVSSGDPGWPAAWLFLGLFAGIAGVTAVLLLFKNPGLVETRAERSRDSKRWDQILARLVALFAWVVVLLIAGMDHRLEWTTEYSRVLQICALGLAVCGQSLKIWAMTCNPFFTTLVRVQTDQTVCETGPYQFVRHPGHAGMAAFILMTPLILESFWALIPAAAAVCLLVLRVAWEDETLRRELNGYSDYSNRVVYRLLPGVW